MKQYSSKYEKMAQAPIRPLIVSLSVPTIITMLVSALYNMADSFFVGRIDTTSVASIGIVFSVMTLLQALGFFLGHGSGIMLSTMLGKKEILKARQYASTAFFLSLITGIILAALGLFFSDSIAGLLGATSTTLKNASDYLRIILIGSPFILSSFVLNNHLRYQGSAVYSMAGIMSGSILNIIIDPVFIFRLNMGVKGAALATVISQIVGFCVLLTGTYQKENLRLSIRCFKPQSEILKNIVFNGLPSLSRQGVMTVGNICLNYASGQYGDAVVAGMSVFNRVLFLGMAVIIGIGQGFQPVCAFNHGAGNNRRVYEGYKFTVYLSTAFITLFGIVTFIFAPQLISLFRDDSEVIRYGAAALRADCLAMPFMGYYMASNMLVQSLRIPAKATVLALARQGLFYIPLILLLPKFLGAQGVTYAQAISDILSVLLTLFIVPKIVKSLRTAEK